MGMRRILRMGTGHRDPMGRILRMGLTCTNRVIHRRSDVGATPMSRILRMGVSSGNGVIHGRQARTVGRFDCGRVVGFPFEDV